MYEVKMNSKKIDGITVPTWEREICSANILSVEAGTTGLKGGDSGHGSRTYFAIKDEGGTDIEIERLTDSIGRDRGFEVRLGGDTELETMIEALKFIVKVLEEQKEEAEAYGI